MDHILGARAHTLASPGGGLLRSQVHLAHFFRQHASSPLSSLSSASCPLPGAEHEEVTSFPRGCSVMRWLPLLSCVSGFQPMGGMMAWIPLSVCSGIVIENMGLTQLPAATVPDRPPDPPLNDDTHRWALPPR
jgi:hypothetical protein